MRWFFRYGNKPGKGESSMASFFSANSLKWLLCVQLLSLLPGMTSARGQSYFSLTLNTAPDIFRMDYSKRGSTMGNIHIYGEDYSSGWGGTLAIRRNYEINHLFGYGYRYGINYTGLSSFTLVTAYQDTLYDTARDKFRVSILSVVGGASLWSRWRSFMLQAYACATPTLLTLLQKGTNFMGRSIFVGLDGGLELEIALSERWHLIGGAGYSYIPTKRFKFEMAYESTSGNINFITETDVTYRGLLTDNVNSFFTAGFLVKL